MVALAGVRLASALRMAGRLDEAEAVLAEVGTPKAGVVRAREQLAWALLHQGELVRAAEHLTRAEEQAVTAQDWPGRAHAIELLGVEGGRTPSPGGARHWSCTGSSARTGARHVACSTRVPRPVRCRGRGLVRDDTPRALDPAVAQPVLLESLWLWAGQPPDSMGTRLVKRHLATVARLAGPPV
jgi:hypothetical protein